MKKLFLIIILSILCLSCETKTEVNSELVKLKTERNDLLNKNRELRNMIKNQNETYDILLERSLELKTLNSGKTPNYIITFELKQSHFTLDVGKHMKDAMNAIEFEMPVSKEFYNSVIPGTKVVDNFRAGSFLMNGSFGNWTMKVKHKRIQK